jgi:predicted enzyme related to lactoylglutathione lyase
MPRPTHFEIPADNPERAIGFYGSVFGWQFQKWEGPMPYWLVTTGDSGTGINGGLHPWTGPGERGRRSLLR